MAVTDFEFQMACLDTATNQADSPELELPASHTVDRDRVRQGMKATHLVNDHVVLRTDLDEIVFRTDADS